MIIVSHYSSLLGDILIAVQNNKLVGLWLENQKYYFTDSKVITISSMGLGIFFINYFTAIYMIVRANKKLTNKEAN